MMKGNVYAKMGIKVLEEHDESEWRIRDDKLENDTTLIVLNFNLKSN